MAPHSQDAGSALALAHFSSNRGGGRRQLWLMRADGGAQRPLVDLPFEAWDPVWVKYLDQ